MFRFLRVNMAAKTCVFEDIPEEYAGLGGRALTSTIVAREVNPICTPLGPHNKLVFAPGLLGATNSPNGNRISVGCKSPLTEGIKESNSGGQPGGHLAKLGIMAIIVEDMATEGEWWQLELSKDSAKLVPSTVAGLNNFDAVAKLVETYGDKCSYVTIGRAGEFKLTAASIAFTDRELRPMRHAGRGGVSGETMNRLTKERGGEGAVAHGCMSGCIIRCSGLFPDKQGKFQSKWPEYETLWSFGPHSGISDIDAVSRFDYMCDDIGVDTIDVGVAVGVAMAGGGIPYGDAEAVKAAMQGISDGTPLGRIIGCGTATTGRVFGVRRVPCVKGQSLPAYDPRVVKGVGVTYATTPMGADHTAGYAVTANILSCGGKVDPLKPEGQIELSRNLQIATASVDSVGLCLFTAFAILDIPDALAAIVDMLNAKYGWQLTGDDVVTLGQRILSTEIDFNRRAGITESADHLPDFFVDEPVAPHNTTFDISHEELKTVFNWIKK